MSNQKGGVLVEILIAILLLASATMAFMGALLSAPANIDNAERKVEVLKYGEAVLRELSNYVTEETAAVANAPGSPTPWHLPGDDNSGWALDAGTHDVTSRLPAELQAAPFSATMSYEVSVTMVNGLPLRQVDLNLQWQNP